MLDACDIEPPPPDSLVVLRAVLMLLSLSPLAATWIAALVEDDLRIGATVRAVAPFSSLLLVCHIFVAIEVSPFMGWFEYSHIAGWWLGLFGAPNV